MYEIPFVSKDILGSGQKERAKRQTVRMAELVAVADKLSNADWPAEWTITGLAFDLPFKIKYGPEESRTPAAIRQQLAAMGVPDEFRMQSSRSLLQVVTAKSEYADRDWYAQRDHSVRTMANDDDLDWDNHRFIATTLVELRAMENRYDRMDLVVDGDYERGTISGRRQALDWLLGQEWPALVPQDEWEAESLEECRAMEREEEAIEGLHTVLFGEQKIPAPEPGQTEPQPVAAPAASPAPDSVRSSMRVAEAMMRLTKGRAIPQEHGQPSVN